ncbi:hypothetical protein BKG71_23135 [Mycobacteroides chelonae]|uniref:hypothetical protein n=1 Tax=Mycobacteroides chelonae TaxID=1774 RepID=UPI0008A8653F|nr:hypothetical protein [Mycobacteroides chelonae]OHT95585.1 hypothetical protein BKG71_23135 [Mycobacteroides chelonae]
MFDELAGDELLESSLVVVEAGLAAARLAAADRLLAGPAQGLGTAAALADLLMARDAADPRWERLEPFERRWSLLVLRLMDARVKDPSEAVADARRRGATWASIASALGVSTQAVHGRFRGVRAAN